jgi:hypothetical protein
MKIVDIFLKNPQIMQLDIKHINVAVGKYFASDKETKFRQDINETFQRIVE